MFCPYTLKVELESYFFFILKRVKRRSNFCKVILPYLSIGKVSLYVLLLSNNRKFSASPGGNLAGGAFWHPLSSATCATPNSSRSTPDISLSCCCAVLIGVSSDVGSKQMHGKGGFSLDLRWYISCYNETIFEGQL